MNIANKIDYTNLNPDCTAQDVVRMCNEAIEYGFKAVCIPPYFVKKAVLSLYNSPVKVATVVGFPMGYSSTPAKVEEVKRAFDEGADEVDVVANICAIKDQNWSFVKNDIDSVTTAAHIKGKVIKLILEAGLLTDEELLKVCQICKEVGVNYVKNSSGVNGGLATDTLIRLLRANLPAMIKIKASGGIKTSAQAERLIAAGAERIGSSSAIALVGNLTSS